MKTVEDLLKSGASISCMAGQEPNDEGKQDENGEEEVVVPISSSHDISSHVAEDEASSHRIQNLQFKRKLTARGRPKRSVRQFRSFNKSAADRGLNAEKCKPLKRKHANSGRSLTCKRRRFVNSQCHNRSMSIDELANAGLFFKKLPWKCRLNRVVSWAEPHGTRHQIATCRGSLGTHKKFTIWLITFPFHWTRKNDEQKIPSKDCFSNKPLDYSLVRFSEHFWTCRTTRGNYDRLKKNRWALAPAILENFSIPRMWF